MGDIAERLKQIIEVGIRFLRARRREQTALLVAATLFWLGYKLSDLVPPSVRAPLERWNVLLIATVVFYVAGLGVLGFGAYRLWRLVRVPELPPVQDRPAAIKGPIAFTPEDGKLFRKLGREHELQRLFGYVRDDQTPMVVLMGASGAGKTSLLRAGLTDISSNTNVKYHYWEAVATDPGERLLRAIQETWNGVAPSNPAAIVPSSLDALINPTAELVQGEHVIVLDQFEQLRGRDPLQCPVLRMLREVSRSARPPHRITWIIAFRRDFRAEWSDFMIPEHERGFFPPELSLRLFSAANARDVTAHLIDEAHLSIEQSVVDHMIDAATVEGEVSPVDIAVGLLVLAELNARQGGKTVTIRDYEFAGGAEGLLTQYIERCLESFSASDRETILKAMLALRDPAFNQRLPEGLTAKEISRSVGGEWRRLVHLLDRLAQRDTRLVETVDMAGEARRYRLPHERLIGPVVRLMGDGTVSDIEKARLKLIHAFTAWKNNERRNRFLLDAADLRLIEPYEERILWGVHDGEQRAFIEQSKRRCRRTRVLWTAAPFAATALALIISVASKGAALHGHILIPIGPTKPPAVRPLQMPTAAEEEGKRFLKENGYPPELYTWQDQLKELALKGPVDSEHFSWLHSKTLTSLDIKISPFSNSLAGLSALSGNPSLKKLAIDLGRTQIKDLKPIGSLTFLADLTLDLDGSSVTDLTPLATLSSLERLELRVLMNPHVADFSPLRNLTSLRRLEIQCRADQVAGLKDLGSLTSLKELTLRFDDGAIVPDWKPIENLSSLDHLALSIGAKQVLHLKALEHLPALGDLTINLGNTPTGTLKELEHLKALTKLNVVATGRKISDLKVLQNLGSLKELDLELELDDIEDLKGLENLKALRRLRIRAGVSRWGPNALTTLAKLAWLDELELVVGADQLRDGAIIENLKSLKSFTLDVNLQRVDRRILNPLSTLRSNDALTLAVGTTGYEMDLAWLSEWNSIHRLELYPPQGRLTDFGPLTGLTSLKELSLDVSDNPFQDLSAIARLEMLESLSLHLNEKEGLDLKFVGALPLLRSLDIDGAGAGHRTSMQKVPASLTHLAF